MPQRDLNVCSLDFIDFTFCLRRTSVSGLCEWLSDLIDGYSRQSSLPYTHQTSRETYMAQA